MFYISSSTVLFVCLPLPFLKAQMYVCVCMSEILCVHASRSETCVACVVRKWISLKNGVFASLEQTELQYITQLFLIKRKYE